MPLSGAIPASTRPEGSLPVADVLSVAVALGGGGGTLTGSAGWHAETITTNEMEAVRLSIEMTLSNFRAEAVPLAASFFWFRGRTSQNVTKRSPKTPRSVQISPISYEIVRTM